jgi:RNA recognition motif-containing protein
LLNDKENPVGKKLHVGNLTYSATSSDLQGWFTPFGTVQSAQVISDRETGRGKGFGFVEMDTDAQAQAAIQGLHDQDHDGRRLTVDEAKPRVTRTVGFPGGSNGGGYGDGGYGDGGGRRY